MASSLAMLPLILIGFSAVLVLILELVGGAKLARWVTLILLLVVGFLSVKIGGLVWFDPIASQASSWRAPFGITFYLDLVSVGMILISSFIIFCSLLAGPSLAKGLFQSQHIYSLILFLFFGVIGALSTGDFFNLYVWFEVFLISSFAILSIVTPKAHLAGVFKYVLLNIFGSGIFLIGLSLLYSSTGTLNMAQVAQLIQSGQVGPHLPFAAASLVTAFLIKMGSFPVYGWLPFSYPKVSGVITAIFSAMLTKVGVFCLLRLHTVGLLGHFQVVGLYLLAATMIFGVVLALSHKNVYSILSHHIISQVGYIAVGIFIGGLQALAATLFFLFHHIVVKSNLFLIGSVLEQKAETTHLEKLRKVGPYSVWLSIAFVIAAGSLAGIPPLSGFWAKYYLLSATFTLTQQSVLMWILIGAMLLASVMTLLSMLKIWSAAFFEPRDETQEELVPSGSFLMPAVSIILMCAWTLIMGLSSDFVAPVMEKASRQIQSPTTMIQVVLNQNPKDFK